MQPDCIFCIIYILYSKAASTFTLLPTLSFFQKTKVYNTYHWMSSWPQQRCAKFDTYHKSAASSRRIRSRVLKFGLFGLKAPPWMTWAEGFHSKLAYKHAISRLF